VAVDTNVPSVAQLQEENLRLRKAVEELSILNEISRVIGSTTSLDSLIESIAKRSVKAVHGQQGMITLVEETAPTEMKTLIRARNSTSEHEQFHLNQNILGWMLINKKPLLTNDLANDPRFSGVRVEGDMRSLLCVPLLVKNRLIGILAIVNKKQGEVFTEDDKRLLSIIASQSGQVLENARLLEQERQKLVMEKELFAAREVQMSLLPKELPQLPNFEFAARTIPAQEVGGDYYDFIPVRENAYELVVADVSGKGISAGLLATMGKGALYAHALKDSSPQKHLQGINQIIRRTSPRKSFTTMLLAVVDSVTMTVTLANAGHCFPLLYRCRSNAAEFISVRGMAINFAETITCEEKTITLEPADVIVLYSDGVNEAHNNARELFGYERLQKVVVENANDSADILLQKIVDEIKIFSKGIPQSDDITLIVAKAVRAG
jgi:sigma-B regulation protein RsbU (phosphoserine phosphatase)